MTKRFLALVGALAWLAASALPADAFTLIGPASVTVNPTSGYPTTALKVDGKYGGTACPNSIQFIFYWDSTVYAIGAITLPSGAMPCDTGPMPGYVPTPGDNSVGAHTVIVNATDSATGGPMPNGSATTGYTIKQPPPPSPKSSPKPPSPKPPSPKPPSPSPVTHQSPSTSSSPSSEPTPSSSPSAAACAATGALPPPSTGSLVDTFIAGAMVASVLPIVGFALFGAGPLLALGRRRRLFQLLGLAILLVATLSCDLTPSPTANASPSPSPSVCTGA